MRNLVPSRVQDFEFTFPGTREENEVWEAAPLNEFLVKVALPSKLSNGMVEDALLLHRTFVTSLVKEGGADAVVNEVSLRKLKTWADERGWNKEQFSAAVMWVIDWAEKNEARLRAVPDTKALEDEQRSLMISPAYKNQSDPAHRATRARISELAKQITARKGGRL